MVDVLTKSTESKEVFINHACVVESLFASRSEHLVVDVYFCLFRRTSIGFLLAETRVAFRMGEGGLKRSRKCCIITGMEQKKIRR